MTNPAIAATAPFLVTTADEAPSLRQAPPRWIAHASEFLTIAVVLGASLVLLLELTPTCAVH